MIDRTMLEAIDVMEHLGTIGENFELPQTQISPPDYFILPLASCKKLTGHYSNVVSSGTSPAILFHLSQLPSFYFPNLHSALTAAARPVDDAEGWLKQSGHMIALLLVQPISDSRPNRKQSFDLMKVILCDNGLSDSTGLVLDVRPLSLLDVDECALTS